MSVARCREKLISLEILMLLRYNEFGGGLIYEKENVYFYDIAYNCCSTNLFVDVF
jgi:hypothetical protein